MDKSQVIVAIRAALKGKCAVVATEGALREELAVQCPTKLFKSALYAVQKDGTVSKWRPRLDGLTQDDRPVYFWLASDGMPVVVTEARAQHR